jgi:hypothetical protein
MSRLGTRQRIGGWYTARRCARLVRIPLEIDAVPPAFRSSRELRHAVSSYPRQSGKAPERWTAYRAHFHPLGAALKAVVNVVDPGYEMAEMYIANAIAEAKKKGVVFPEELSVMRETFPREGENALDMLSAISYPGSTTLTPALSAASARFVRTRASEPIIPFITCVRPPPRSPPSRAMDEPVRPWPHV